VQHYWGWAFFKNEPWKFPIGMFNPLSYPNDVSIIFTDSIPLFAIIFKFILRLINYTGEFQYFGFYGLLCFCLQSFFGMLIVRKIIKNDLIALMGGLFFCFSPFFIYRMFVHTAHDSHYLILASICLILYLDHLFQKSFKFQIFIVTLLAFLSVLSHIYLVVMCGIFVLAYSVLYGIKKDIFKSIIILLMFIVTALFPVYILGGFSSPISVQKHTNNVLFHTDHKIKIKKACYSNIRFMFNCYKNTSKFFNVKVKRIKDDFYYLGFGVIILMILSLFCLPRIKLGNCEDSIFLVLSIIYMLTYIIAIYPFVIVNGKVFLNFSLPYINVFFDVFCYNERFGMISSYLMMVFIFLVIREIKLLVVVLLLCMALQIYDTSQILVNFPLHNKDRIFTNILTKSKHFILENSNIYGYHDIPVNVARTTYLHNAKLTNFYFARPLKPEYDYFNYKINHPEKGDLFIFEAHSNNFKKVNCSQIQKTKHYIFCQI